LNPLKEIIKNTQINTLIQLCGSYLDDSKTSFNLQETDWQSLILLSKEHRVIKTISDLIKKRAIEIPSLAAEEIHSLNKKTSARMLVFTAEIAFISNKLNEVSIASIPLKGPIAAKQIYNDFTAKNSRDIDFLIHLNQLDGAILILEKNGYTCTYDYQSLNSKQQQIFQKQNNQLVFIHPKKRIQLEIHWKLFANPFLLPITFDELLKDGSKIELGNKMIPCLSKEHLLFYLCVHGAKHHWSLLYWILELATLIKNTKYNWENTLKSAISLGIERPFVQGMLLVQQLFDIPISNNIISYSKEDSQIQKLVDTSISVIYLRNPNQTRKKSINYYLRVLFYKMRLRKEFSYKLSYWKKISINDFDLIKLPQSLFFLYFWLRPFFWCWRYLLAPKTK
jgi:hypothetical protein